MKGKYIFLLVASMTGTFVAGVGAHMEYMQIREEKMAEENKLQTAQTENQQEQIEVRILDGYVEWFDGAEWRRTESVEILQEKDPYYIAKEAFEAFEESYQEELEQENQIALEEASFVMMKEPLVGVEKSTAKETTTNKKTNTGTSAPAQEQTGDSSGYTPDYTPSTPSIPAQPETPVQPETPAAPDAGTGDGEDIGWSEDYL